MSILKNFFRKSVIVEVPISPVEELGRDILGLINAACNRNSVFNVIDGFSDRRIVRPIVAGRYNMESGQYEVDVLDYIYNKGKVSPGACRSIFIFYVRPSSGFFKNNELYWVDQVARTEGAMSLDQLKEFKEKIYDLVVNYRHYR